MTRSVRLLSLVLVAASGCAPTAIRGHAGAAFMQVQGQTGLANSSGTLSPGAVKNDFEDALDVGDRNASPYLRAEAEWSRHRVTFSGFQYDENGQSTLASDFGDIPAGTSVNSSLEFWNVKGAYSYDIIPVDVLRIAPGVEVAYSAYDFDVVARTSTAFESLQVDGLVPMVFLQGEVDLGVVAGVVDLAWIDADLEDTDGTWWDIEAMVRVVPIERLELIAGYRFMQLDLEGNADGRDFDTDMQVSGLFFGGGVRF